MFVFVPTPCCFYYSSSIVQFKVGDGVTSISFFIINGYFVFLYDAEKYPFKNSQEFYWNFDEGLIESVNYLW